MLYTWPFAPWVGGLERLSEVTARELTDRGHHVTVVTSVRDPEGRAPFYPFAIERRPGLRRLVRIVRSADVVHLNTFSIPVALLALLLKRPIVWHHIDFDTMSPRGICYAYCEPCVLAPRCYVCLRRDKTRLGALRAIVTLMAKRLGVPLMGANIVNCRYAQNRLQLARPHFVPFGIDTGRFTPLPKSPAPPLNVLFVARHIPAKGCDVLIRALARCEELGVPFHARIAGDGPHRPVSQMLAAELGLGDRVEFLGYRSDDEIIQELRQAHVVVVPTMQDEIGQLVVSEAMSCETVVVASAIGALPELVGDVGLLFPPGNHDSLAAHLRDLAANPEHLIDLGRLGREYAVAEFDVRKMGERYLAVYREITLTRDGGGSRSSHSDPTGQLS